MVFILIVNIFLLSSSNTFVLPFLPFYLKDELDTSPEMLPFFTAVCYSVTYIIAIIIAPLWGHFADKFGRKKMLGIVLLILALSYLLGFLATSAVSFCMARALQGLSCGITPVIISMVSSMNDDHKKIGMYIGYIQSANLFGTIIGSGAGGFMTAMYGVKNSYFIIMIVVAVLLVVNLLFIRDDRSKELTYEDGDKVVSLKEVALSPIVQSLCACVLVSSSVIMMIVPILAMHVMNIAPDIATMGISGIIFSLSGIAGVTASPLWSKIGNARGFLFVLSVSSFLSAVFYFIQAHVVNLYVFSLIQFLFGICICAPVIAAYSIIAKSISKTNQTKACSLIHSFSQLGSFIGPIISSTIVFMYSTATVFTVSAIMLIVIFSHICVVHRIRIAIRKQN